MVYKQLPIGRGSFWAVVGDCYFYYFYYYYYYYYYYYQSYSRTAV